MIVFNKLEARDGPIAHYLLAVLRHAGATRKRSADAYLQIDAAGS